MTGEILAEAGETISLEKADELERRGVNEAYIATSDEKTVKVFGNAW